MSRIARVELTEFTYVAEGFARDPHGALCPHPTDRQTVGAFHLAIETEDGLRGEYVPAHSGKNPAIVPQVAALAPRLIGQDAFAREHIWHALRWSQRHLGAIGLSAIDVCLWDLAGKATGQSIARMLGGFRTRLPTYASTTHADRNGVLSSKEAFAEFALHCRSLGLPGFKIHGWGEGDPREEAANLLHVRRAIGDGMALMIDPACMLQTFADALHLGHACDEAKCFWYEDPFADMGTAIHAHKRLREKLRTPLLLTEHVRTLEAKLPWLTEGATDFLRADPEYDGGITGVMKHAHLAEAFGVDVELHGAGPAQRHCMAAIRNTNFYELSLLAPGRRNPIPDVFGDYSDELDSVGPDGCVPVPTGPGLGVTYDLARIRREATASRRWPR
jgi:L-alanine-DL-glutamate epimerase-like enolase superfamily enzyme